MYTLEQLSLITSLTTRTLHNYIKLGILKGNKENGKWLFTEEQLNNFVNDQAVMASIKSKSNGIIYDFLAEYDNAENETCILLDLSISKDKANEISKLFCEESKKLQHFRFSFIYKNKKAHYILKGSEEAIKNIMKLYYGL